LTENLTKTEAIGKLISLAKEMDVKDPIDWNTINLSEDQAYEMMAGSVLDQMFSIPESHREIVLLATLTKLLVENLVLNVNLQKEKQYNATSTNRS
jgi:hypothetical protein